MVWRHIDTAIAHSLKAGAKPVFGALISAVVILVSALSAYPATPQTTTDDKTAPAADLHPYVPPASTVSASAMASSSPPVAPAKKRVIKPVVTSARPALPGAAPVPHPVTSASGPVSPSSAVPPPTLYGRPLTSAAMPVKALAPLATTPVNPAQPAAANAPISPDDIETFTDSIVRTLMQRDHVLGVSVAVVQGATPVLIKGYGYDRLSPARHVDPATSLFRIGSITKAMTWIVARQEIEAGRIKLDAPIDGYLPPDIYAEDRRFDKPLTLRDLMDHTSGYEDTSLGNLFQISSAHMIGPDSYFHVHKPKRVRDPNQFSSYSNFGVGLAARALEQTARAKDVPTLLEARVFQPLGMAHTTLREPYTVGVGDVENLPTPLSPELTRDLSDGFIWDGATYKAQPFDHALPLSGALGGSSTAADMARLMTLMLGDGQLDGVQLYNADSAHAFRTPMLKMPKGYNGWASGLMIREAPAGYTTYGHSGATLWFNSNLVLVPELNLGIFITTNTQTGSALATSYPNLLLDHLQGDLVRPPLMPSPAAAYAQHRDYYEALKGQYVSTRRAYSGLEGAVTRLINTVQVTVDGDGRLILTTQNGLSAFVPDAATGFFTQQDSEDPGPAQETGGLHFLFNADGNRVSAFETASNLARYERVGWIHSPETVGLLTFFMIASCVLVWISLAKGPARYEHPGEHQSRATLISAGISMLWLIAIFIYHSWSSKLAEDPSSLFTHWPSGQVRLASLIAALASIGTLYQAATFFFVATDEGRHNDGWALWQKTAHGIMLAYWLFYITVLVFWGALEFWSW